jgi:hypothetical protein
MKNHFPDALAVSYINFQLFVELEEVDLDEHIKRLEFLPQEIADCEVALRYHNGSLNGRELKRLKEPNPTMLDGDYDDTDYVKDHGCFYPGAMLSSKNNSLISAGIQVQKEDDVRLTVAIHCWDNQLNSGVTLGHEDYNIKQGDWAEGTVVGTVTERIGTTDIGLARIHKPFTNRFLDLNGSATRLVHSNEITKINDVFWIDSFVTGPQQLSSNGIRVLKAGGGSNGLFGPKNQLPEPGKYIELFQGIYATSTPEINTFPKIREGVCGAAVLRSRPKLEGKKQEKSRTPSAAPLADQSAPPSLSTPKKETPSNESPSMSSSKKSATPRKIQITGEEITGEVAGFMHWADVQSVYNGGRLLCFVDVVNGLIEDGWKLVPVPEKRKAGAAGLDDDLDPFVSQRSPKK